MFSAQIASDLGRKFEQDGFLIFPDLHTPEMCDQLMQRGMELAVQQGDSAVRSIFQTNNQTETSDAYFLDSGDKISVFFEKDAFNAEGELKSDLFHSLNKIGHAMHDLDPVFQSFSRSDAMKRLASHLGLESNLLIQSMLIFKHARIGGMVDVHQDSTFLYTEPESCVGFWFALEDATQENGCLWAKPGGHRTTLRSRFARKAGGGTEMLELDSEPLTTEGMIPLEVKKGTCIVLHGLLPHYSLPNTSGKSRQAYAIHTISPHAHYAENNWLKRNTADLRSF